MNTHSRTYRIYTLHALRNNKQTSSSVISRPRSTLVTVVTKKTHKTEIVISKPEGSKKILTHSRSAFVPSTLVVGSKFRDNRWGSRRYKTKSSLNAAARVGLVDLWSDWRPPENSVRLWIAHVYFPILDGRLSDGNWSSHCSTSGAHCGLVAPPPSSAKHCLLSVSLHCALMEWWGRQTQRIQSRLTTRADNVSTSNK